MTQLSRRGILGAIICAPAIVRASSLMRLPAPMRPTHLFDYDWRQSTPEEIEADMIAFMRQQISVSTQIPLRYLWPAPVHIIDMTMVIQ